MLPVEALVRGMEQALPGYTAGLGIGGFARKVLHSGDLAPFWDPVSGVQFEPPPNCDLEPVLVQRAANRFSRCIAAARWNCSSSIVWGQTATLGLPKKSGAANLAG